MTSTQSKPLHGKGRECVITRRACFSSSHRYWLPEKTPEEKILELEDKLARSFAEMENQRRRFEKEKEDAFEYGGYSFAKEE